MEDLSQLLSGLRFLSSGRLPSMGQLSGPFRPVHFSSLLFHMLLAARRSTMQGFSVSQRSTTDSVLSVSSVPLVVSRTNITGLHERRADEEQTTLVLTMLPNSAIEEPSRSNRFERRIDTAERRERGGSSMASSGPTSSAQPHVPSAATSTTSFITAPTHTNQPSSSPRKLPPASLPKRRARFCTGDRCASLRNMFNRRKALARPGKDTSHDPRLSAHIRFSYHVVSDAATSACSGAAKKLDKASKKIRNFIPSAKRHSHAQTDAAKGESRGVEPDGSIWDTAQWGPILDISDTALAGLVQLFTFSTLKKSAVNIKVLERTAGHNNAVYTVQYRAPALTVVCVRVPACGWGDHWNMHDAESLRNTALMMRYIKTNTTLPVPDVLQYDTTFNNPIKAPYIMTSCIPGRPLLSVWHNPSPHTGLTIEDTRQNILRSLASSISALRLFTFPAMGPLLFAPTNPLSPHVDAAIVAPFGVPRGAAFSPADHLSTTETSSQTFHRRCLAESRAYALAIENTPEVAGVHALFSFLLDAIPWPAQRPEAFVLAPPGFKANNVLVDERGHLTGILDWDGAETLPALLGWAAFPDFLAADVVDGVAWYEEGDGADEVLDGRAWDKYREAYAQRLEEACLAAGGPMAAACAAYTRKSHWYRAVLASLGDLDRMRVVLDAVLAEALPRVRRMDLVLLAGQGALVGERERVVRQRFRELLA